MTLDEELASISKTRSDWKEVKTKASVVKSQITAKKKPLKKVPSDNLFASTPGINDSESDEDQDII